MSNTVEVRVPGTTANCGPGFDTLGIACTIYNTLTLTLTEADEISVEILGEGCGNIAVDESNICLQAIRRVMSEVNCPLRGIRLVMENTIPLARGLGSSAAAIVGGLVAANAASGKQLSDERILELATEMEGHPDNVAPALFGGITVSLMDNGRPQTMRFLPPAPLTMVVAIPEFELATKLAREVLPAAVPYQDAIYNVSRTALLAATLCQGRWEYMRLALADRLHQPYRAELVPGLQAVMDNAVAAGALGAALSGAGPCVMAFTVQDMDVIGDAMVKAFTHHGVNARYLSLSIDSEGAKITRTA